MRMITIMVNTTRTPKMPPIKAPAIGPIAKELPEAAVGGVGPVVGSEFVLTVLVGPVEVCM